MTAKKFIAGPTKNPACPKSPLQLLIPQIFACTVKNYAMLTAGITTKFPTIIIPALSGITRSETYPEIIHFTREESSWFGSFTYIGQLIGSVVAGYVIDAIGRKSTLLLTAIPPTIALISFYFSNSVWIVFAAYAVIGINNGILQIACITYTGEICQANIRAVMVCTATVAYTLGNLILYTLGSLTKWRQVSLICLFFPISSFLFILTIPETPIWLLSKKKDNSALQSLQWLRGWVSASDVVDEFQTLKLSLEKDTHKSSAIEQQTECTEFKQKLNDFMSRPNLIPFLIAILLFMVNESNGFIAMTPFLVQIFKALGTNVDANWSTVVAAGISLAGTIGCATSVKFLGKRKICLIGLAFCAVFTAILGIHAITQLPPCWNSFEIPAEVVVESSWIPLICIAGLFLFTNFSITDIPWIYMAELFPFRTRAFSTSITMTIALLMGFLNVKMYKDIEIGLSIGGAMLLFSGITAIFIPIFYVLLPETEGVSTADIEKFFAHENHRITNVNIKSFLESQK